MIMVKDEQLYGLYSEKPVFIGRSEKIKEFDNLVRKYEQRQAQDNQSPPEPLYMSFHGMSGVGKSALLHKLESRIEKMNKFDLHTSMHLTKKYIPIYFSFERTTDFIKVIASLRNLIQQQNENLQFTITRYFLEKYETDKDTLTSLVRNSKQNFSDSSSIFNNLLTIGSTVPSLTPVSTTVRVSASLTSLAAGFKNRLSDASKLEKELRWKYDNMALSEEQFREALRTAFLIDLDSQNEDYCFVFLMDTFELISGHYLGSNVVDSSSAIKKEMHDWFIKDLPAGRNVICVYAGQEGLFHKKWTGQC